jgi:hypothetical protein
MDEQARDAQPAAAPAPACAPPVAPVPTAPAALRLASAVGNCAFRSAVAEPGSGLLPGGAVHSDVANTIAARRGGGAALDEPVRERMAGGLGDPLADVRIHTDDTAAALARAVSARAFATGSDVYFDRGEYRPGTGDGDRLIAHELAHVVQQRGAVASGPLTVTEPGGALERDADAAADTVIARSPAPASAPVAGDELARTPAVIARNPPPVPAVASPGGAEGAASAAAAAGKAAEKSAKDYSDAIALIVGGATGSANYGKALGAGANGVQTLTLAANVISDRDKEKLQQITLFRLLDAYCARYVKAHPEVVAEGPKPPTPPTPPPAPDPASQPPTGSASADAIDLEIMAGVKDQVAGEVDKLWVDGVWPDGHEYIWGEGNDNSSADWVGVTGAIAFSNLKARAMSDTPALGADASRLSITLASPGPLVVRQIVGGTLDKSGSWKSSWWDNLAVNIPTADPSPTGPGGSSAINVQSNWIWDDNVTTWDFRITVGADGTPQVQQARSGTPDDSKLFGSGVAGKHQTLGEPGAAPAKTGSSTPARGGYGPPGAVARTARLARTTRPGGGRVQTPTVRQRAAGPVVAREPMSLAAIGAAIGTFITAESTQIGLAVIQGTISAGSTIQALEAGTTGVAAYNIPGNQMSDADIRRLRQLLNILLLNQYCQDFLTKHPELNNATEAQPAVALPAAPPANNQAAPSATGAPTSAPPATEIDSTILALARSTVTTTIDGLWKYGQGDSKPYVWGEDNTSHEELIGITGTIAFSNLRTRAIAETPVLNASAKKLGVNVPDPGRLVIRQVVSGTLDGTIKTSWFDDLVINPTPAVVSAGGPDSSVQMNIGTNWIWDKNTTVWDFVITVKPDGTPSVEDSRNGTPGDSTFIEWGDEGGTHKSLKPAGGKGANVAKPAP